MGEYWLLGVQQSAAAQEQQQEQDAEEVFWYHFASLCGIELADDNFSRMRLAKVVIARNLPRKYALRFINANFTLP